jgi:hypothetical protein
MAQRDRENWPKYPRTTTSRRATRKEDIIKQTWLKAKLEKKNSATVCNRRFVRAVRNPEEKYFGYSVRTTRRKIIRLLRLQHYRLHPRRLCLATLGGSPSRTRANYRQRSGARHQLAPEYGSSYSRPTISSISATRRCQQRSGARQQLRLRS